MTTLWGGAAPEATSAPSLKGWAAYKVRVGVTRGGWKETPASDAPVAFGYQWERCGHSGGGCEPISGATNETYLPAEGDISHRLRAEVFATNGGGTTVADSPESEVVEAIGEPRYGAVRGSKGEGAEQFNGPAQIALDAKKEVVWVADPGNNRVEEYSLTSSAENTKYIAKFAEKGTGNGQVKEPYGIAVDEKEDVWIADTGNNRIEELNYKGEFVKALGTSGTGKGQFKSPKAIAIDSSGNIWVADTGNNRVQEFNSKLEWVRELGTISGGECNGCLKTPEGIATRNGNVWVADTGNNRIEEYNSKGEYVQKFGTYGPLMTEMITPRGIFVDTHEKVWVADTGNSRVDEYDELGRYYGAFGVSGTGEGQFKEAWSIVADTHSHYVVVDHGNSRIELWTTTPVEGSEGSARPGSTIEYGVPLEGSEAPQQMGINKETGKPEPEKWNQTDDPEYATTIFPPDEAQRWPANDYRRATTYYFDKDARTVNVASPTGGIATTQYDRENQVEWSLSAVNRATALKAESPSESVRLLRTESAYNGEGQLAQTWGPQHLVKLASGKEAKPEEALVRNHVKYYYDEGAPSGESYDLATKIEDNAENAAREDFDTRTATTSYSGQSNLGWKLREPTSATTDPGGLNLTTTTVYDDNEKGESTGSIVEARAPAATGEDATVPPAYSSKFGSIGSENGQFNEPMGAAVAGNGDVYVLDRANSRVEEFTASGGYLTKFGTSGTGNGQFKSAAGITIDPKGNLWVADTGNNRIEEFNSKNEYVAQFGIAGTAAGQFKEPKALAFANGALYVSDLGNHRVEKFNEKREFVSAWGFGVSNGEAKYEICTSSCQAGISGSGNGQFNQPFGVAVSPTADVWVTDAADNRLQEFKENGEYLSHAGAAGTGNGQFKEPKGLAIDSNGGMWVADTGNNRIQKLTSSGAYVSTFGTKGSGNGQFETPLGIAAATTGVLYVGDLKNNRVERWLPAVAGNPGAHDVRTIYYTAGPNEPTACGGHIEWANLPCEIKPVAQASAGEPPEPPQLPTKTITYNMWDQPETVTEAFGGSVTRTTHTAFDEAGRPVSTEETSSKGQPLSIVTDTYSETNGTLKTQSRKVGATTQTITTAYNNWGQLESYTDADGNVAKYTYDEDGRPTKISDGSEKGEGKQTYTYDATTGFLAELVDSGAGKFTATYDVGGRIATESYPNGMKATYTYDSAGNATALEYKKTTDCTEHCVMFEDTLVPSVHGEIMKQKSTLAEEPSYVYDAAGRLTQVQEIPVGEGCTTRIYTYDEDSNRATLTTRTPGSEGKCASEGGSTEWHTYDTADRLTDSGTKYETLGNTEELPAADTGAGAGSEIKSKYYVDGQLYEQTQSGKTSQYQVDPDDRTRETTTAGTTTITHYDGAGATLAWTGEGAEGWTRNIPGIDGTLTAVRKNGAQAVLEIHDLQGNIVGTASLTETETKLLTPYNSTEFGAPVHGTPPKYAWLGASGLASNEQTSGLVVQDGVAYVPQTGRPLQAPRNLAPGLPTNAATPFVSPATPWVAEYAAQQAAEQVAQREQENAEREAANPPPGAIPGWCSLEEGTCEPEEAIGEPIAGIASHKSGFPCKVSIRLRESGPMWLWAEGQFSCLHIVPTFELEVCILVENFETHQWQNFSSGPACNESGNGKFGQAWPNTSGNKAWVTSICADALKYRGWAWGRVYGNGGTISAMRAGKETKGGVCTGKGSLDFFAEAVEAIIVPDE